MMRLMPPAPVLTLEMTDTRPVRLHEARSLAEASSRLPPGAYTTLRTYGGRGLLRLETHLRRLEESAARQGNRGTLDRGAVRGLIAAALVAGGHPESRLRLTFAPPRLYASVEAFVPRPPALYERGVACVTLPGLHRERPRVKDTLFIAAAERAYGALPVGVEEGLLVASDGALLEGLSSNVFAILDGALRTEEGRVLSGITRALVLEVAEARMPVVRRAPRLEELPRVREAFLTSTSRGVLPVVRIDGTPIGNGGVGPLTRQLMNAFVEAARREAETVR